MSHVPAVQTFQYQLYHVRVIERDGEPWFNESDVKRALGLRSNYYGRRLLASEKGTEIFRTPGGPQRMTILSESGVYKLAMRSNKEAAEPFQNLVTQKILPAYRKKGLQTPQPALDEARARREQALYEMDFELRASVLFGIPPVCALQEGVKRVQRELDVDMSEYLQRSPLANALPAAELYLEIAELSQRYHLGRGVLNAWLMRHGHQYRLPDGSYVPSVTAEQERLCYRHLWAKGTKSGDNLKWRVAFIDASIAMIRQYGETHDLYRGRQRHLA
jgi:prophage antirepressor-like protein